MMNKIIPFRQITILGLLALLTILLAACGTLSIDINTATQTPPAAVSPTNTVQATPETQPSATPEVTTGKPDPIPTLILPIDLYPQAEAVDFFVASNNNQPVQPGDTLRVSWSHSGVSASICMDYLPRALNQDCVDGLEKVAAREFTVPSQAVGTVAFHLYVEKDGRMQHAQIDVPLTVARVCQYEWFFDEPYTPYMNCPDSSPVEMVVEAQIFETGVILRLVDSWMGGDAWVLPLQVFETGEYGPTMNLILDQWDESMPVKDSTLIVPDGKFQPEKGMGLLWQGRMGYITMEGKYRFTGLASLGWAVTEAFSYRTRYQCADTGCYFEDPYGYIIGVDRDTPFDRSEFWVEP